VIRTHEFDRDKFAELVLYIADQSVNDPDFGGTKLNKILFFSDFLAYAKLGSPITGASYQKLKFGPAPRALLPVRGELEAQGDLAVAPKAAFTPQRLIALRPPALERFSAAEISLVDHVIKALDGVGAKAVSDFSHEFCGWQVAAMGEDIPYASFFWDDPQGVTADDIAEAEVVAKELALT
jgi:hypothetical protein